RQDSSARRTRLSRLDDPCAAALDKHTVAGKFIEIMLVSRQRLNHYLAPIAQCSDACAQCVVVFPGSEDRTAARLDPRNARDFAQIERKAGRRPRTAVRLAD